MRIEVAIADTRISLCRGQLVTGNVYKLGNDVGSIPNGRMVQVVRRTNDINDVFLVDLLSGVLQLVFPETVYVYADLKATIRLVD